MSELTPHPWHGDSLAGLIRRGAADRLPHGLLLTGAAGIGKSRFAGALAASLLCRSPAADGACGACRDCRLFSAGAHPDYLVVAPEAAERPVIKVDQIRGLIDGLMLSSQQGGRRVAVIDPAERLNPNAANSLLKTLEEPPASAVLILVSGAPARLPATVRSRCQTVTIATPPMDEAAAWLRAEGREDAATLLGLANGAPLEAIALADAERGQAARAMGEALAAVARGRQTPSEAALDWQETGARTSAELACRLLADALRVREGGRDLARIPEAAPLYPLVEALDGRVIYDYIDDFAALRRALEQPLNEQLALEWLFGDWRALFASDRGTPGGL